MRIPSRPTYNESRFMQLYFLMQLFGALTIAGIFIWIMQFYDGLSWSKNKNNFHYLFMVLGMVYLSGNSLILFRALKTVPKSVVKIVHATVHISALLFSFVGLLGIFIGPLTSGSPVLFSLHSWIGISCVTLFFLQYVVAFYFYTYPTTSGALRSALLPYHVLFGFVIFGLATMAALTGIAEKMTFAFGDYKFTPRMWLLNFSSISLILFSFLVFYLGTERSYSRLAVPEQSPNNQQSLNNQD